MTLKTCKDTEPAGDSKTVSRYLKPGGMTGF